MCVFLLDLQLKGCSKELIPHEVDRIIQILNLGDKQYARSKTLSGGMKRKLSIGIALIGDSKVKNAISVISPYFSYSCSSSPLTIIISSLTLLVPRW